MRYYLVMHSAHGFKIRFGVRAKVWQAETLNAGGRPPAGIWPVPKAKMAAVQQAIRLGGTRARVLAELA